MAFIELKVLNNVAQPILGIDLGTTNSLVAIWRDGRPVVLRPDPRDSRIPSVIHFPEKGDPIVGRAAREYALSEPGSNIFSVKRFMGRGLADVGDDVALVPYPVGETENDVLQFDVNGRKYTPQELSALILIHVHDVACKQLEGGMIDRVVLTVPAYFDDTQRQATRDAARLAELEVVRIINEPTAASLAYGLDQRKDGTIAVYDLGGGTFDVSILSIEEGVFRVLATAGDTHLGGDDIDHALMELALEDLRPKVGAETASDPAFLQGLKLAAEKCKIELSRAPEADFHFVVPEKSLTWHRRIMREELDELTAPLIRRTLDACRRTLSDADLETDEIDEVVLVGGSTRIPFVRARVEEFFGKKPHTELNPDEVVALGAAVQGHILAGGTRDILLMDVTPLSLGLETMGGAVAKIIVRNSPIPCQTTEGFTTYADNQTGIDFNIVQGERELASDCRSLGRLELGGIPPMPAGMARVMVRFQLDADGILTVTAKEETTGEKASIEVKPMHGLTDDEVERMLKESFDHAREDFEARLAADLKVEIGIMARATQAHLADAGRHLDRETMADIEEALAAATAAAAGDDLKTIQATRDELERATLPLATMLMDDVAKKALTGKSLDEV
ncbi:MAG: Fe-S protein assembly chaperone HscA [Planctomycetota bacterium]|nr:Fe-S protein assembly chaperone HscA [Planctomycetota bacterium]